MTFDVDKMRSLESQLRSASLYDEPGKYVGALPQQMKLCADVLSWLLSDRAQLLGIAEGLAKREPLDGELGHCTLCFENTSHSPDCPYRLAQEFMQELQDTHTYPASSTVAGEGPTTPWPRTRL